MYYNFLKILFRIQVIKSNEHIHSYFLQIKYIILVEPSFIVIVFLLVLISSQDEQFQSIRYIP